MIPNVISYSALRDLDKCPYSFKLSKIDRIWINSSTIDTHYGTVIHAFGQNIIRRADTKKEVARFERLWTKFRGLYKNFLDPKEALEYQEAGVKILQSIRPTVEKEYGLNYQVFSIEEKLQERAVEEFSQQFKGFIDVVLLLEDGSYVLSDLKTCDTAFTFKKYADKEKERQLVLYKHFLGKKHNIELKKIRTSFILLEKSINSKEPVQIYEITSGNVKVRNHMAYLSKSLKIINNNPMWVKNRTGCRWCSFNNTEYCENPNKNRW